MSPQRIQQRRTKGWRKPVGAVSVARPSRWGNPYTIHPGTDGLGEPMAKVYIPEEQRTASFFAMEYPEPMSAKARAAAHAVWLFRERQVPRLDLEELRAALQGRDLMCWCSEGSFCHADVLLELVNGADR